MQAVSCCCACLLLLLLLLLQYCARTLCMRLCLCESSAWCLTNPHAPSSAHCSPLTQHLKLSELGVEWDGEPVTLAA